MSRAALIAIIAVLAVAAGVFAYQAHERDENTLDISVSPSGVKVD